MHVTSCQGAYKDIVVHYWKLKCDKNDGKFEVINFNQCAFYCILNRASQTLSIEIHHTISKIFSMRISLRFRYLVSLPDFVKFCMSSFHYLLRGKVQRLSSPFNYLGNVFQYYVNLVGVPNFKMNVQVMPSLSKPINGLSPVWFQNGFETSLFYVFQSSQTINEGEEFLINKEL